MSRTTLPSSHTSGTRLAKRVKLVARWPGGWPANAVRVRRERLNTESAPDEAANTAWSCAKNTDVPGSGCAPSAN